MIPERIPFILTEESYGGHSLNDWQQQFLYIYGEKNENRTRENICNHLIDNASQLSEDLRKNKYGMALVTISRMFSWIFALLGPNLDLQNDVWWMEDIIWNKYPYLCPYCTSKFFKDHVDIGKEETEILIDIQNDPFNYICKCPTFRKRIEELSEIAKSRFIRGKVIKYFEKNNRHKKDNLLINADAWVDMLEEIYGNVNFSTPIEHIAFHLHEEIGEVQRVLMKYDMINTIFLEDNINKDEIRKKIDEELKNEIADVFSWMSALINKINSLSENFEDFQKRYSLEFHPIKISLSTALFREYRNGCPDCRSRKCLDACRPKFCLYQKPTDGMIKCKYTWEEVNSDRCPYNLKYDQRSICEYEIYSL